MNARIQEPKPCIVCGKLMHPEDYLWAGAFERTKCCSMGCGGRLRGTNATWGRFFAHEVTEAMEFSEIAAVAGVSRQCIWAIYESAMRKLRMNPKTKRALGDWT